MTVDFNPSRGILDRASRPRRIGLGLLLACALFLAVHCPASAAGIERVGQGELMSRVARSRGKLVLVHFWASWCSSCRREIDVLSRMWREYPRKELDLLGISMDDNEGQLARFLEEYEPAYPVYMAGGGVASSFGVTGVPKTIIYDGQGRKQFSTHGYVPEGELRDVVERLLEEGRAEGK